MELDYAYHQMTGLGHALCHWLAYRFEADVGFRPEQGESWIGWAEGPRLTTSIRHTGWITGLYQTDTKVWATEATGMVFFNPTLGLSAPWESVRLEGVLRGVWGLSDDHVFVWGLHDRKPIAFHWDGSEWREVGSPGFILRAHGSAPDLVYGVGQRGLIARWNGSTAFESVASPVAGTVSDVFVASEDEMYACTSEGELLQGTVHGWEVLLRHPVGLTCVAKWRDAVWVGAEDGLYQLADEELTMVRPQARPIRFDARGELMITEPELLTHSLDGVNFRTINLDIIQRLTAHREPTWR